MERLVFRSERMPKDALFSHRTAAWLHGLDFAPCDPIEVTLPRDSRTSHLAGTVVRRSDYAEDEVIQLRGLRATSPVRTVADLARRGSLVEAVVVIDMALRAGLTGLERLSSWAEGYPRHRGLQLLQTAMELADAKSESPMESRLRVLLVTNGLPTPAVQPALHTTDGTFIARPDLYYADCRLALEFDGMTHRTSLAADDRRQNRMIEEGYRVLRFTAGDLSHRPASVVAQVRRSLSGNQAA